MDGSSENPPAAAMVRADDGRATSGLWEDMADELVELIACYLTPCPTESPWLSRPLATVKNVFAEESVGAAHWLKLSKALHAYAPFRSKMQHYRRRHRETKSCSRVLESYDESQFDWPLMALRLRSAKADDGSSELSHSTPIARHTLRLAYWAVAREVHPDRLMVGSLATQAMTVLNDACAPPRPSVRQRRPSPPRPSSWR